MGLQANSTPTLQGLEREHQNQNLKDLDGCLLEAEEYHPVIKVAKEQWEAAKERVAAARAMGLPTLDFVGNFYQNGYPNQGVRPTNANTTTVGLTLTIPIFEGFGAAYKIRGAQAQAECEDTSHQILLKIVRAHVDAVSSLANLDSSLKLFEAASAAISSSIRRNDKGAADILEFLTTQTALAVAQQERIRCLAEYRFATLRLLANAGVLGRL